MNETELKYVKDKRFEELREGIRREIQSVHDYLDIISGFLNAPKDTRLIMNRYSKFFLYTQWAHIKLLCISIYNVTKHDEQTCNIPRLLCYVRFHKILSKNYTVNDMTIMENKIKKHSIFLENVYVLRDQYYAHNQLKPKKIRVILKNMVEGSKLLYTDIEKIYRRLSMNYDRSVYAISMTESADVEGLLNDLNEYKKIKLSKTSF